MTNERAIELLHRLQDEQFDGIHGDERREALSMAVRALEQNLGQKTIDCIIKRLNDEDRTTDDLISRKQVLNASHFVACWDGVEHFSLEVVDADFTQKLPSVQPTQTNADSTHENTLDCVSRQAAIDLLKQMRKDGDMIPWEGKDVFARIRKLPSAQPDIIRCKDCIYYDPPHVENNGVRYEYDEMPAGAFDALGTGLVNAEYGINIGGRCCVDYYCKNYSDDKRVFVREDNYCGRAERRTEWMT